MLNEGRPGNDGSLEDETEGILELEQLREDWLADFIGKGGFQHLLTILKTFVTKYKSKKREEVD